VDPGASQHAGAAPLREGFAPEVAGVAVIAVHNLAVHRLLPAPADAALNVLTAAGLTALARRAGCSEEHLGIRAADAAAGLRLGLVAAAVATGGVALGASLPATRPFFRDERVTAIGRGEAIYHLVVRIPVATALAEELAFRGALLGLILRRRSRAAAVGWTSLLFGASHALPTLDHYHGNPASGLFGDPRQGRRIALLGSMLSTSGAGCVFAWLRLRSRSLVAPIVAHAAINVSAYVAGRWVAGSSAVSTRSSPSGGAGRPWRRSASAGSACATPTR
jgi:membrane protease YdiL (CAAX protease family)